MASNQVSKAKQRKSMVETATNDPKAYPTDFLLTLKLNLATTMYLVECESF